MSRRFGAVLPPPWAEAVRRNPHWFEGFRGTFHVRKGKGKFECVSMASGWKDRQRLGKGNRREADLGRLCRQVSVLKDEGKGERLQGRGRRNLEVGGLVLCIHCHRPLLAKKDVLDRHCCDKFECEICLQPFDSEDALMAHNPCRAYQERRRWGLSDRLERARQSGRVSHELVGALLIILECTLSMEAYRFWLRDMRRLEGWSFLYPSLEWSDWDHFESYCLLKWAAFLALVCPRKIGWPPDGDDLDFVRSSWVEYSIALDNGQRRILRQLVVGKPELEKVFAVGAKLSGAGWDGVAEIVDLPPRKFAEECDKRGLWPFGPVSHVKLCKKKSDAFRKRLKRLSDRLRPKGKKSG